MKNTLLGKRHQLFLIIRNAALFMGFFCWISIKSFAGDGSYFFYGPDGKNQFELNRKKVLIKFNYKLGFEERAGILAKTRVFKPLTKEMEMPAPKVVFAELARDLDEEAILEVIKYLNKMPEVDYANPFLSHRDGTLEAAQDRFAVKLFNQGDLKRLQDLAKGLNLIVEESYKYDPLVYFVKVTKQSPGNAMEMANRLAETKIFKYSEPDMLREMKRFNTNDPELARQWSLNNTATSNQFNGTISGAIAGADMRVFNAWGISAGGSSTIKIAIIDEGVDLNHPDLLANLLPGFDGTGLGSNGGPSGNDAHGTACAGIAAAVGNNNVGIAGVAYNCKIIPVRIAYSNTSGNWVTTNAQIGTSLDWSWNQGGADVLSNSWGGGSSSSLINDPITRANTQGRGGLGAPVLFAAGNSNGANSYPATLTNVVSVVAMSMCNQRKNPASCDGENFWGSNFGTGVDVAAPGVKIYTCDISGSAGYSTGNYTATFNGTSSACPNAAGVMALVLSVNSGLNVTQARQILESSCDKVGGYTYNAGVSGQPNGTWSTDLGHGRVNAFSALQLANPQPCVAPPPVGIASVSPASLCLAGTVSLSLSGVSFGTGQTYQWQSSPDNSTWTNISGATNMSASVSASANTWYRCQVTCSGNTTNSTVAQVTFTNATVSTFPHVQNFDGSSSLPCGWSVANVNNDGNTWNIGTTNSRSAPNNVTYTYNASVAANDWLFSAPLQLVGGTTYRVRFWQRVRSATYPENLEVRWGSSASAAGMTSAAIYSGTGLTNTTYTERTGTFTPASSGVYYVGWRAFSNANMWDINIDDVTIDVNPTCTTPPVAGTAAGSLTATAGTASSYTLTGWSGTGLNWQTSPDGTTWTDVSGATTASVNLNFNPGTIRLRARVTGNGCADVFSNVLIITVNPRVGDNLSLPIQVNSFPFTASISNAAGSGFTNAYSGTNNQTSADIFYRFTTGPCASQIEISSCGSPFDTYVHLLNASGTNLSSNDDNGVLCSGSAGSLRFSVTPNTTYFAVFEGFGAATGTISVSINQVNTSPTATITAGGATTFCQGGSVLLTASAGASYLWSTGATTQSITASSTGNYSVVVTNAAGCASASASQSVTVNANPSVSISTSGPTTFCDGNSVTLSATAGASYAWSNGASSQAVIISSAGNYSVTVTDANGCQGSASQSVTVNPNPSVFNVGGGGTYCTVPGTGVSVSLSGSETGVDYTFSYTGNGTPVTLSGTGSSISANGLTQVGTVVVNAVNASTGCSASMNGSASVLSQTASVWYQDSDGDGFGNGLVSTQACSQPSGYVANNLDCNDNASTIYLGATEICGNGIDDDCDEQVDEGCVVYTWYQDSDGDGFGNPGVSTTTSTPNAPSGYVAQAGDCNDNNNAINPNATEICNGFDDDCDGLTDEGLPALGAATAIAGPAGVCRNATGQVFSINPIPGATSYIWTLPTGATGSSTTNSITLAFSSTYVTGNLCVRAVNACGQGANFCRSVVYYSAAPGTPVSISGPVTDNCVGTIRTFSTAAVANATSYTWTAPTNTQIISGQGTNSIQLQVNSGFLSGSVSVRAENCRGNSSTRSLTIYLRPATPSSITGPINGVCVGTTQTYSCPVTAGATSYNWTVPANAVINSGQGTNSISVTFPGVFTSGTVSVVAANACSTSTARSVTVRSVPAQPGNIAGQATNLCGGGTFNYSITAVAGALSYNWTIPAGCSIITNTGTAISLSVPSNFVSGTLSVSATNGCGTGTARSVTMTRQPSTPSVITGPTTVCPSTSGLAYSVTNVAGLTYNWTLPSGATIVSGAGTNAITANWGTVAGTITVRAANACTTSSSRTLSVTLIACRPAFEEETVQPEFTLYPNPGTGQYSLSIKGLEGKGNIRVYNMLGSLVKEVQSEELSQLTQLNLMEQPSGAYLLKFNAGGFEKVMKVVKQ